VSRPAGWYGLSLSAWMDESVELPQEQDVLKIVTAALAELGFSRMDGLVFAKAGNTARPLTHPLEYTKKGG